MDETAKPTTNEEQIAYWSGGAGETWAALQPLLDRQLAPLGQVALAALASVAGERVLDVGCGGGTTTRALAAQVGAGNVVGVDISGPLLAAARARAPELAFVEADAQTYAFAAASFDAIYSRFGVMFFTDPDAAFANLARALRPGGRLAFVCWRRVEENPIMTVPLVAAVSAGLPMPPPGDPLAPGPFAFADDARVRGILARTGFVDVAIRGHDERVGGNDPAAALELALQVGPLGRMLREHPELRAAAIDAVRAALVTFTEGDQVRMPSATWIVTATRGA